VVAPDSPALRQNRRTIGNPAGRIDALVGGHAGGMLMPAGTRDHVDLQNQQGVATLRLEGSIPSPLRWRESPPWPRLSRCRVALVGRTPAAAEPSLSRRSRTRSRTTRAFVQLEVRSEEIDVVLASPIEPLSPRGVGRRSPATLGPGFGHRVTRKRSERPSERLPRHASGGRRIRAARVGAAARVFSVTPPWQNGSWGWPAPSARQILCPCRLPSVRGVCLLFS
jgi:hypothetical protein